MIRINPIYQKEIKQTARMKKVMVLLLVFNTLLILFGLFAFYLIFQTDENAGKSVKYSEILRIYTIISAIESLLIIFLTPGLTAGAISGEREKQTLDILLSTDMSIGRIVLGKLFASIHFILLLMISSLPVFGIIFYIGGITFGQVINFIFFLFITAIYIGSIGIFFSSVCKRSTIATVSTYAVVLLLTIGLTFALFGNKFMEIAFADTTRGYVSSAPIKANGSFLVLLLNPVFSYAALIEGQVGITIGDFGKWNVSGPVIHYVIGHWQVISAIVQLALSTLLLYMSKRMIQPHSHWKFRQHHKV